MITPKIAQDIMDEIENLEVENGIMNLGILFHSLPLEKLVAYDANAIRINQLRYELKKWEENAS